MASSYRTDNLKKSDVSKAKTRMSSQRASTKVADSSSQALTQERGARAGLDSSHPVNDAGRESEIIRTKRFVKRPAQPNRIGEVICIPCVCRRELCLG
jgi:hypothetical protein